jgi:L-lysine 2,3-aminomutase
MAQTPEGKVKTRIKAVLKKYEVPHFFPVTGGFGHSGWFDVIACYRGRFIGIEAKATKHKPPTALQTKVAEEVFLAGGVALLIHEDNIEELERTLKEIHDSTPPASGTKIWPTNSTTRSSD